MVKTALTVNNRSAGNRPLGIRPSGGVILSTRCNSPKTGSKPIHIAPSAKRPIQKRAPAVSGPIASSLPRKAAAPSAGAAVIPKKSLVTAATVGTNKSFATAHAPSRNTKPSYTTVTPGIKRSYSGSAGLGVSIAAPVSNKSGIGKLTKGSLSTDAIRSLAARGLTVALKSVKIPLPANNSANHRQHPVERDKTTNLKGHEGLGNNPKPKPRVTAGITQPPPPPIRRIGGIPQPPPKSLGKTTSLTPFRAGARPPGLNNGSGVLHQANLRNQGKFSQSQPISRAFYADDDDEPDEDDLDFIDDGPVEENSRVGWRAALRGITGYDPRRFAAVDNEEAVEASTVQQTLEEIRSARLAAAEDAEQLKLIREDEARARARRLQRAGS